MEEALDMSLDDLIKRNRKSHGENPNFRNRGRGSFRGNRFGHRPNRWVSEGGRVKATPYSLAVPLVKRLRMREGPTSQDGSYRKDGTKLYVSNLDRGVSNEDIKVLFSDVGELKRYAIHYDVNGRSQGTAEVVYARHSDALSAIKRYNDVHLDGRPIKIELVGFDADTPAIIPPAAAGLLGYEGDFRSNIRYGLRQRQGHGGAGGTKRERRENVSAEALDADLEKYHQMG